MKKMTKNENNDSFMRDKNIVRAVDGKRKSHCVRPKRLHCEAGDQAGQTNIHKNKLKIGVWFQVLRLIFSFIIQIPNILGGGGIPDSTLCVIISPRGVGGINCF